MIIYMATNKINGKEYIGQTVGNLQKRKRQHIRRALSENNNVYFCNAIRKHGPDNFDWEILHDNINDIDDLNRLEVYYIKLYDTYNNGYNLTLGGGGRSGCIVSDVTKKKLSVLNEGKNNRMYGSCRSGKEAPMYGKRHSKETKKKMSEGRIGKYYGKDSPVARAVIINGNYFDTITEASKFFNISPSAISMRLKRQTYGCQYIKNKGVLYE